MYIRMKNYIELILTAIIVVLMIEVPTFLEEMVDNSLGKLLLLSVVGFLLCYFGKNAGILAAIIVVIILYKTKEGFAEGYELKLGDTSVISLNMGKKEEEKGEDKLELPEVAKSGFKLREGADCSSAKTNSDCDKCSDSKLPFYVEGEGCKEKDGFTTQEIDKLKRLASKEGFQGYNGRQRKLIPQYSMLNTTDLDRDVKEKAERAKISASKEEKNQES